MLLPFFVQALGSAERDRSLLQDVYESHTKHCPICMGAMRNIRYLCMSCRKEEVTECMTDTMNAVDASHPSIHQAWQVGGTGPRLSHIHSDFHIGPAQVSSPGHTAGYHETILCTDCLFVDALYCRRTGVGSIALMSLAALASASSYVGLRWLEGRFIMIDFHHQDNHLDVVEKGAPAKAKKK